MPKIVFTGGPMPEPDPDSDIREEERPNERALKQAEQAEAAQKEQEDAFWAAAFEATEVPEDSA